MFAAELSGDVRRVAIKLHKQFAHPPSEKLIDLLKSADLLNDELKQEVIKVSDDCEVCCKFKKPSARPIVSMPLASKFNDVVAMDLKVWGQHYFLVIVDLATRFCAATVIGNKLAKTIIKGFLLSWVTIFGAPKRILSDNGCEFNNSEMRQLGEAFNVKVMTTAAESPWSNGVCERLNAVLGNSVRKILCDSQCDLECALAWAVVARNALLNSSGFSPNQLVFGFNPAIPNVFSNKLPAHKSVDASAIVRDNLNAMHTARQDFIKCESSEKIKRALRHNVRSSSVEDVTNGDEVYYKRNDDYKWHGPGKVIGRDGKQVLVKHGGVYVRVHSFRLCRAPDDIGDIDSDLCKGNAGGTETKSRFVEEDDDFGDTFGKLIDGNKSGSEGSNEPSDEQFEDTEPCANDSNPVQCTQVKIGQRITGVNSSTGEHIAGKIVSRTGKATGKYKNCYNLQRDIDGSIEWIDLKDVNSLTVVPNEQEMLVMFNSDDVISAKELEINNWIENEVYEEVPDEGQDTISVRWIVTEKIKGNQTIVKARLVARGFEEESSFMRKDSPTCSKECVRLALAIACSNRWKCHSIDIKAAYLQGNAIQREIHLMPPPEYFRGFLWKLKKTVYGLCDAARAWYLRVKTELLTLGVSVCSFEPALFYWNNGEELEGIICVYVDDFLWAGTKKFENNVINKLKDLFLIGNSVVGDFKYLGLNIESTSDSVMIDQAQYITSLKPISI